MHTTEKYLVVSMMRLVKDKVGQIRILLKECTAREHDNAKGEGRNATQKLRSKHYAFQR